MSVKFRNFCYSEIVIFRLVDLIKEGLDDAVASKEEEIPGVWSAGE